MPPAQDVQHMVHCPLAGRDIRAIQQGKRGNHDTFKQRTFRPNPGQHPHAHQHPEQVTRNALRRH